MRLGRVIGRERSSLHIQLTGKGNRHASVLSSFESITEDAGAPSPFQAAESPAPSASTRYDPVSKAKGRKRQLPASRYVSVTQIRLERCGR